MSGTVEPTSQALLANLAKDYSSYVRADLSEEGSRLDEYMQECLAKMDELGSLFDMTEFEQKDWAECTLPALLEHTLTLNDTLSTRLGHLKTVISTTRESLDKIEEQMNQAATGEHSATTASSSFRSVLNYFKKPEPQPEEAPVAKPAWNR